MSQAKYEKVTFIDGLETHYESDDGVNWRRILCGFESVLNIPGFYEPTHFILEHIASRVAQPNVRMPLSYNIFADDENIGDPV